MRSLKLGILAVAISLIGIGCTRIDTAHSGISVSMAGSKRGVQDIPIKTGWVFYNPLATRVVEYPAYVQSAVWTKDHQEGKDQNEEISFNSRDGLTFWADVNLSYVLKAEMVPHFYMKYKADDITTFTHGIMRQIARDEVGNLASTYTAEEIYGEKKEELCKKVRERLNAHFQDVGLSIESFGFIGAPRCDGSFTQAINNKLSARQKAEQSRNEVAQAEAEANKAVAQAKGEAEANRIKAASITPAIIEWRKMDIQEKALLRWNGSLPTYMGGSQPTPMFDVTNLKK